MTITEKDIKKLLKNHRSIKAVIAMRRMHLESLDLLDRFAYLDDDGDELKYFAKANSDKCDEPENIEKVLEKNFYEYKIVIIMLRILSSKEKFIICQYYFEGFTYKEITALYCKNFDIENITFRQIQSIAKESLKKLAHFIDKNLPLYKDFIETS